MMLQIWEKIEKMLRILKEQGEEIKDINNRLKKIEEEKKCQRR